MSSINFTIFESAMEGPGRYPRMVDLRPRTYKLHQPAQRNFVAAFEGALGALPSEAAVVATKADDVVTFMVTVPSTNSLVRRSLDTGVYDHNIDASRLSVRFEDPPATAPLESVPSPPTRGDVGHALDQHQNKFCQEPLGSVFEEDEEDNDLHLSLGNPLVGSPTTLPYGFPMPPTHTTRGGVVPDPSLVPARVELDECAVDLAASSPMSTLLASLREGLEGWAPGEELSMLDDNFEDVTLEAIELPSEESSPSLHGSQGSSFDDFVAPGSELTPEELDTDDTELDCVLVDGKVLFVPKKQVAAEEKEKAAVNDTAPLNIVKRCPPTTTTTAATTVAPTSHSLAAAPSSTPRLPKAGVRDSTPTPTSPSFKARMKAMFAPLVSALTRSKSKAAPNRNLRPLIISAPQRHPNKKYDVSPFPESYMQILRDREARQREQVGTPSTPGFVSDSGASSPITPSTPMPSTPAEPYGSKLKDHAWWTVAPRCYSPSPSDDASWSSASDTTCSSPSTSGSVYYQEPAIPAPVVHKEREWGWKRAASADLTNGRSGMKMDWSF